MHVRENIVARMLEKGAGWLGRKRLAQTSGQLHLPGVQSRVEIFRDRQGVPHIYAQNEHDLFYAQGFVHAQDRFWQMEFQRRLVAGRLSEMFGKMALFADRWMRILGLRMVAEEEVAKLYPEDQSPLHAYCEGVNAYIENHPLPIELELLRIQPEPWTPADSLSWSKMMSWMLSGNWECELFRQQLVEKLGEEMASGLDLQAEECWPLVLSLTDVLSLEQQMNSLARLWDRSLTGPGPREGVGSNNWVVSGARSVSGMPILANDMHLRMSAPAVWYENHLVSDSLNLTGISLPGIPLLVSGHNGRVAWGFTAGFADVQDLYEQRLRETPDGQVEYEYKGEWHPAEVRREEIHVRGGEDHIEEVVRTRQGPIINPLAEDEARVPLSLCWTALETSGGTFHAMARMNHSRDCYEFREALRTWGTPVLNVVYADVDGNIAYNLAGKVPLRGQGQGKVPVPGWEGKYDWVGFIPFEELPHIFNPPEGYIASANNRVAGPDYQHWLGGDYVSGDRAERIIELIHRCEKIDIAYIQQMHLDQVSPSAQTLAGVIGQLAVDDPHHMAIIERMRAWDGSLAVDSMEAAVYEVLTRQILLLIFEERLGDLMPRFTGKLVNPLAGGSLWGHHAWEWLRREILRPESAWFDLGAGQKRDDLLRLALARTVDRLAEDIGPDMDQWNWGHYHTLTFQHQLGQVKPLDQIFNRGPFPIGGDGNTIWASASMMDRVESSDGVVGPPFRFIADLSDLDHALGILVPGNSGQIGSPHYDDQIEPWFNGAYHTMLYRREDVIREQQACLELLPME
jgi:penicillin G amidase